MRAIEKAPSAVAGSTSDARPVAARRREPPEPDGEDEDEQEPEPVHGHGLPQQHADGADGIEERIAAESGQDAGRHRHHQGQRQARRRQLERRGQRLADQGEGGHLMLEGEPEVSADGAEEKAQVLDPERIIESQQRAELPDILLAGFERQEQPRRITGEVQEPEDDHRDAEKNQHTLQEPAQDVGEHVSARPRTPPSGDGPSQRAC